MQGNTIYLYRKQKAGVTCVNMDKSQNPNLNEKVNYRRQKSNRMALFI